MREWARKASIKAKELYAESHIWEDCDIPRTTKECLSNALTFFRYADIDPIQWRVSLDENGCIEIEVTAGKRAYTFVVQPEGGCGYFFYEGDEHTGGGGMVVINQQGVRDAFFLE